MLEEITTIESNEKAMMVANKSLEISLSSVVNEEKGWPQIDDCDEGFLRAMLVQVRSKIADIMRCKANYRRFLSKFCPWWMETINDDTELKSLIKQMPWCGYLICSDLTMVKKQMKMGWNFLDLKDDHPVIQYLFKYPRFLKFREQYKKYEGIEQKVRNEWYLLKDVFYERRSNIHPRHDKRRMIEELLNML